MSTPLLQRDVSRRGFLMGLAGVAGATALAPLLTSCAKGGAESVTSGPIDVSVWTNDQNYPAFFDTRAQELSKTGDYQYTVTPIVSSDIWTKALAAFAAKAEVPSLLGVEISQFSRFMKDGIAESVFLDLSGKMGQPDDAFLESRVDPFRLGDGIYAMESATTIMTTYKRLDLWEKFNIPEAHSWQEYLEIGGQQFAKNGIHLGMIDTTDPSGDFAALLRQRGADVFDSEGNSVVDSAESLECLILLNDALENGTFAGTNDFWGGPGIGMMKSNKIAALWAADWLNPFFLVPNLPEQKGMWQIAKPPVFEAGGFASTVSGGTGFTVIKDRPETEAALALLQDAYGTESGQIARFKDLGYLPTLKSAWDAPEVLNKEDEFLGGQKVMEVYKPLSTQLPTQKQDIRFMEFMTISKTAISDMFVGKLTPTETLKQIATELEK